MTRHVLSPEETRAFLDHMRRYDAGEIEKPAYIDEWQKKIDEAMELTARAMAAGYDEQTLERMKHAVVAMMHKKDRLYTYWVEGRPYRTWDDIATSGQYTDDELFFLTCIETEDYLNGAVVQAFVLYLDQKHFPGILNDFTQACLRDCDVLLEEVIELTPEVRRMLAHPQQVFESDNQDVIETKMCRYFSKLVTKNAPSYAHRVLAANILAACGKSHGACVQLEFAKCEAAKSSFPRLMETRDPEADVYLEQAQRWLISMQRSVWR